MKNIKKIAIFMLAVLIMCSLFSLTAFAAGEEKETATGVSVSEAVAESGKLDMNLGGEDNPLSFSERLEYALQGTATGMLMVFGVLALLTIILYISKYFLYDLPRKDSPEEKAEKEARAKRAAQAAAEKEAEKAKKAEEKAKKAAPAPVAPAQDDAQIAAVITAAIAAMIESGDYKNEFVGGFRVVSFKRNDKTAWNRR